MHECNKSSKNHFSHIPNSVNDLSCGLHYPLPALECLRDLFPFYVMTWFHCFSVLLSLNYDKQVVQNLPFTVTFHMFCKFLEIPSNGLV